MRQAPSFQPKRVALYIRWSTDEQTEGTTLETQKERCTLYARSQGWEVDEDLIFVDEGYSGGSLHRPALTRLRELVRLGEVDCIVVYSLDRLSRNMADTVELVQNEWLGRCVLRTASQPIGTDEDSPTGQLIFNILASFAEFERGLIRERTYSGSVRRAREGKYPGSRLAPFGYKRTGKGQLSVDTLGPGGELQGPAAAVRRIFDLAATGPLGQGPAVIARTMEQEGWPAPGGNAWWGETVRWILRHPVYAGDVTFGRTRLNQAARRNKSLPSRRKGQEPLVHVPGAVPAIVPRELWERVQTLCERRRKTYTVHTPQARNRSLLSSIARCKCGGPLSIFKSSHGKRYYRCTRNFMVAGGCGCDPGLIDAAYLEHWVTREVRARYGTAELKAAAIAEAERLRRSPQQQEGIRTAIAGIEERMRAIEEELARVRRAARKGEIALTTFEELRRDAQAERAELEQRRGDLAARLRESQETDHTLAAWKAHVERVDAWDELDTLTKREVLSALLREVRVYRRRGDAGVPAVEFVWELRQVDK